MIVQRQFACWIVGIGIFIALLYVLRGVLLPFVAGMVLAYLLDPLTGRLERLGLGRVAATGVIVAMAGIVFVLFLMVLVPVLTEQLVRLVALVPDAVAKIEMLLEDQDSWLASFLGQKFNLDGQMTAIAKQVIGWLAVIFKSILGGGMAFVSGVSLLVVTPVVAFYLMVDWPDMLRKLDSLLPRPYVETIRQIVKDIDGVMAGFLRGQAMVCLILAVFYALALTLVGLNLGLLIGFTAGAISFIPFVGSIVGLVLSLGMALAQTWPEVDWLFVGMIGAIFVIGQLVEGNILQPRLLGKSVRLHPVALMFSLFAFGYLFGFLGMLLAVPLAAVIGVLVRFATQKYLASQIYLGNNNDKPIPADQD
jgi:predicted PurR-regulated permease PerM